MKATFIALLSLAFSVSAYALEDGKYINNDYTPEVAQMYKAVTINTSKCEKGGAIVHFHNADPMNFCIGNVTETVFKYKKCIGKELPFPLGHCIGIKKTVVMKNIRKVLVDESRGSISLLETNLTDDEVTFTQIHQLTEVDGNIRLNHSFSNITYGTKGELELLFEKTN